MKDFVMATVCGAVLAGILIWGWESTPVVQKSYSTGKVIACATKDTDWEMVDGDHPACRDITTAEVEWVK